MLKYRYLTGDHTTWQDIPSLWRRGAFCWVNYTTAYLVCNLFSVMIITVRTSSPRGQRRGGRWVKQDQAGLGRLSYWFRPLRFTSSPRFSRRLLISAAPAS